MLSLLKSIFKSKKDRDVEQLTPIVAQVKAAYQQLQSLTDDQLRAKTAEFKNRLGEATAEVRTKMDQIQAQVETVRNSGDTEQQEKLFAELDKLKKDRNQLLEKALLALMPEAFAVVKETCRRLTHNGQLAVTATEWDKQLAQTKPHVVLEGGQAIWKNEWLVTGNPIKWDMVHYDVQLMGGAVLHQGKISEMATGEGKTLVATLPVYLNALAGLGVHLVTVNDYLARRDKEWNAPIFEFHGLSVDCIDLHEPNTEERRAAYLADITYGTNNEFGFDYLRDNMVTHPDHLVQREHHYAIVDEVDSVLVDEARTPLIISGPVPQGEKHEFDILKPRIDRLVNMQRRIVTDSMTEARTLLQKGDKKNGGFKLLRATRGLPKHKPLIKYLSETGIKTIQQETEAYYMQDNSKNMHLVDEELYFTIDEKNNQIELTDKGREAITTAGEDPNLFVLPDLTQELYNIEGRTDLDAAQKLEFKEKLSREFSEKSERLHSINQLLKAYTLFEKDIEYIVQDGKVLIVDENTGRVLAGRRYSDGLHQAIEAKENVKVEAATQTFATITLQNYFRMYHKLAGMTGTAETEAAELYQIYKLDVVVIPTNKAIVRKDAEDLVYKTRREKFNAIADEIVALTGKGRPVLVGTTSVEISELLSRMLKLRNIRHNVLNAKQHQREAEIVAEAGKAGTVTIATNMAGRGTDIKLGPGVREAGGLAIIGSERHESRRIDRQLRGRAGRQGDPGSSQFFVSLEDDLMRLFGSERIAKVMDFLKIQEGEVIQDRLITRSISNAQKKVEENNFAIRKRLLEYDDVMNNQREGVYSRRRNALFGDRIKVDLDNMIYDFCAEVINRNVEAGDAEGLRMDCLRHLSIDPETTDKDFDLGKDKLTQQLYERAIDFYRRKQARIAETIFKHISDIKRNLPQVQLVEIHLKDGVRGVRIFAEIDKVIATKGYEVFNLFEKTVMLGVIDDKWQAHLREMDDLKQSVQTAVYEQKDPLLVYKFEAYNLFQQLLKDFNLNVLSMLFRGEIEERGETAKAPQVKRDDFSRLKARHDNADAARPVPVAAGPDGADRPLTRRERREQERKKK
jgi:preprotein translocase subunit SecA